MCCERHDILPTPAFALQQLNVQSTPTVFGIAAGAARSSFQGDIPSSELSGWLEEVLAGTLALPCGFTALAGLRHSARGRSARNARRSPQVPCRGQGAARPHVLPQGIHGSCVSLRLTVHAQIMRKKEWTGLHPRAAAGIGEQLHPKRCQDVKRREQFVVRFSSATSRRLRRCSSLCATKRRAAPVALAATHHRLQLMKVTPVSKDVQSAAKALAVGAERSCPMRAAHDTASTAQELVQYKKHSDKDAVMASESLEPAVCAYA